VPAGGRTRLDRERHRRGIAAAETPDGAGVSLYLDRVYCGDWRADPVGALTETNLADYCTALEGVSHFVYSTWRLDRDLPVCSWNSKPSRSRQICGHRVLAGDQQGGAYPAQVHARLFDR